jgi:hypothetical protein
MKIRLIPEEIAKIIPDDEDEYYDLSMTDLFYNIQIMKVALMYGNDIIEPTKVNDYWQVLIPGCNIWISKHYYDLIEE